MTSQYPGGEPVYRGAEAYIYIVDWLGAKAVLKKRIEKAYRHPQLDTRLRRARTVTEARLIAEAAELGVAVPKLLHVDPEEAVIVLEYVEGVLLSRLIDERGVDEEVESVLRKLGRYVAILHENGVVHGDLSTSNVVVRRGEPYIIDFGLAEHSDNELDKAVDIHLFRRSLESTHPEHVEKAYRAFMKGYAEVRGAGKAREIEANVERIRAMGRYVEEARRVALVWGARH